MHWRAVKIFPTVPIFNEAINMNAVARFWALDWVMGNARFILNELLQTDTTKKYSSWLAFNFLRITWNDTAILHDLSSSFLHVKLAHLGMN
jgi:hypothetical protein